MYFLLVDEAPVLKADALKYVMIFRSQVSNVIPMHSKVIIVFSGIKHFTWTMLENGSRAVTIKRGSQKEMFNSICNTLSEASKIRSMKSKN